MAASERLGLNLQPVGENINTWGGNLNDQALALLDEAFGVETIALAGSRALTSTNFMPNEARNAVLNFTSNGLTSSPTVSVPAKERVWIVNNKTSYAILLHCGGTPVSLAAGRYGWLICDGSALTLIDPVTTVSGLTQRAENAANAAEADSLAAANAATSAGSSAGVAAQAVTDIMNKFVISTAAPNNADGRPDGTVYFKIT